MHGKQILFQRRVVLKIPYDNPIGFRIEFDRKHVHDTSKQVADDKYDETMYD
jgi:hypothetical protein